MSIPTPPFGRDTIASILPHRDPFLLLDEVNELEPGTRVSASYRVPEDGWWFAGHFPERPVMPGVLIVEAMAQSAAVLSLKSLGQRNDGKWVYYFVGIDGARFKRPVVPGDTLVIEVTQGRVARGLGKFAGVARVGGAVVAEAQMLCALREIRK